MAMGHRGHEICDVLEDASHHSAGLALVTTGSSDSQRTSKYPTGIATVPRSTAARRHQHAIIGYTVHETLTLRIPKADGNYKENKVYYNVAVRFFFIGTDPSSSPPPSPETYCPILKFVLKSTRMKTLGNYRMRSMTVTFPTDSPSD
jgi:hypothetical protein